ncbi:MAG: YbjQ family protein [Erythrobacter sp.]
MPANLPSRRVILVTTTPGIEGHPVKDYLGLVSGEVILGANVFRDMFAGLRDFFGGRAASYERVLEDARERAVQEMQAKCDQRGGNAVVGADIDYEVVGKKGSMLMVTVTGTAVRI